MGPTFLYFPQQAIPAKSSWAKVIRNSGIRKPGREHFKLPGYFAKDLKATILQQKTFKEKLLHESAEL